MILENMRHQKHFLLDRFLQSYQLSQRVVNATTDFLKMNCLQKLLSLFIASTQKVKYNKLTSKEEREEFKHRLKIISLYLITRESKSLSSPFKKPRIKAASSVPGFFFSSPLAFRLKNPGNVLIFFSNEKNKLNAENFKLERKARE